MDPYSWSCVEREDIVNLSVSSSLSIVSHVEWAGQVGGGHREERG